MGWGQNDNDKFLKFEVLFLEGRIKPVPEVVFTQQAFSFVDSCLCIMSRARAEMP